LNADRAPQLKASVRRTKGENKHMDVFGMIGFTFGIMGFIFSLTVMGQVAELKKEVEKLKSQV
jgi:methylaspartate ammonia-lyase